MNKSMEQKLDLILEILSDVYPVVMRLAGKVGLELQPAQFLKEYLEEKNIGL